eukprot:5246969-Heterocapsa_arctica.AAC.1
MVEDHEVSQLPFRAWRVYCVRGRAKSMGHFNQGSNDEEQIHTVRIDYGFFGAPGELPVPSVGDSQNP